MPKQYIGKKRAKDPNSNRSEKRLRSLELKRNNPDAILACAGDYVTREHNRDGRKRDYLRPQDAEKLLGQSNHKVVQQYHYQVPLKSVIMEAEILCKEYGSVDQSWLNFVTSAHYNVSVTGWHRGEKRNDSVTNTYAIQWLALNYPQAFQPKEKKEEKTIETEVKIPYKLKDTAPKTTKQSVVKVK